MSSPLNLLAPEVRADPYPFFAELRRRPTLTQVEPGGFWAVTRYADVVQVFKNPQIFSSTGMRTFSEPQWLRRVNPFADSMVMLDPPRHTRLRALVNRAFGPTALARLEPRIRAYARQAAQALPLGRPVDFIQSFALPVPASVIGELLGLDPSLHSRFKRWSDDIVNTTAAPPDALDWHDQIRSTYAEMEQYLLGVIADRRLSPREDMVSDLLGARVEGEALTEKEVVGFLFLLLVAGLETTVHLLSHSALNLAARPEVVAWLRADRSRIPAFIDEVLRYEAPAQIVVRQTTAETELGGTRLPAGALVMLLLGAASRDETHFPDADRFDPSRTGSQSIPFGHGIHFCLGAALARLEARVGLEALLSRFGAVLARGPVTWNRSLSVRGPTVLPVELVPA